MIVNREMLELAAVAAGYLMDDKGTFHMPGRATEDWDPSEFNSDAMSLANRLEMDIKRIPYGLVVSSAAGCPDGFVKSFALLYRMCDDDKDRTLRTAITAVAADYGQLLKSAH